MTSRVSNLTKSSAFMLNEIVMPSSRVIRLVRGPCAVSDKFCRTPHSLIKLPNIRHPTKDAEEGAISPTIIVTMIGNRMRVLLDTEPGL